MDASKGTKRKLSTPFKKQMGQKRQKVKAGSTHQQQQRRSDSGKRAIAADSLPWKTLDIPEMFDDAEGFFGLEEVKGVEVVRTGDTVQFLTTEPATTSEEDEEFAGFDDEPGLQNQVEGQEIEPHNTENKQSQEQTGNASSDTKKQKMKKNNGGTRPVVDEELEDNIFTGLGDMKDTEDEADMSAWTSLDLSPRMLSSLAKMKFYKPTAIQAAAIPHVLQGHDVIGKASTGSGKTLAFGIPIVESWLELLDEGPQDEKKERSPIALVLSPTRELAHQLAKHMKELCANLPSVPHICAVTGGLSVHKQQRQLETADIVVGTPGRMWEVLSSSTKLMDSFRRIRFLVVDEADRILTEGHFQEAKEIFAALDRETQEDETGENTSTLSGRQTLVFSATFNKGLQQKLAGKAKAKFDLMSQEQSMEYLLNKLNFRAEQPTFVDVNPVSQMAEGLKEGIVECGAMEKDLYLYTLLLLMPNKRTLVFTNSISSVRRLAPLLQNLNVPALPLHSQMPQKARLRSVERFTAAKPGTAAVLVATDVAARGLDIPGIDAVLHYHVPRTADAYVHRSGRTARAATTGLSVLLCGPEEATPTRRLVAKVHAANSAKAGAAAAARNDANGRAYFIRTVDIDRRLAGRLRERVDLAKKIADAALAKEKGGKEDSWVRTAAEELGVEYDSDEMEAAERGWGGRGAGRKQKERQARGLTKAEVAAMRAELKAMLVRRVNTGVSEKYLTGGQVDVDALLGGAEGGFLGQTAGLGLDD